MTGILRKYRRGEKKMNSVLFDWIFAIVLFGVGIALLTGHGDLFMGGEKGASERKGIYDDKKMAKGFGVGFLLLGAANVVTIFVKNFVASTVYMIFIILVIVGEIIYIKKYCKK